MKGVGVIAGLIAIVLLVWQAIRLANINLEIGMTPAMITAALAALLLLFTLIRVIDGYEFADRTIWLWLGLLLAVVIAVGAWMNMQATGEGISDIRASVAGAAAAAKGAVDRNDEPAATAPPATPDVSEEPPAPPDAPDDAPRAS
jgi:cation transport ATPase